MGSVNVLSLNTWKETNEKKSPRIMTLRSRATTRKNSMNARSYSFIKRGNKSALRRILTKKNKSRKIGFSVSEKSGSRRGKKRKQQSEKKSANVSKRGQA
jgi:hypothetical protein